MTTEMSTTEEIIGRSEIDDFETILSVVGVEEANGVHVVHSDYDSMFTWDYEKGARPKLNKLYEKAKGAQWNGETDLPWEQQHTRITVKALEWDGAGRDSSFLLRGSDLAAAERWLAEGVDKERGPTALEQEYLLAARQAASRLSNSASVRTSTSLPDPGIRYSK